MIVIQVFSIGHSNASSARVTFWYTYNSNIKLVFIKYTWKTDEGWSQLMVKTLIHLPIRRLELMLPMDFELKNTILKTVCYSKCMNHVIVKSYSMFMKFTHFVTII